MRRYIRANAPGATYFFTLTLQDRGACFLVSHIADLREVVTQVKQRHPFRIDAMVVLPDHLHALWTLPPDDNDFSTRWTLIKQGFTRRLNDAQVLGVHASRTRGKHGERSLWQRRFWEHQIRDGRDFANHVDYIHFNPVKHGLALKAADWPHSSFHRAVRLGLVRQDWGMAAAPAGRFGE
jgi:putative transposase